LRRGTGLPGEYSMTSGIAIFAYANMSSRYQVKSEYEVSEGYIDLTLLKRDPWHPDHYPIFELKYLKRSMSSEEEIERMTIDGTLRMKRYISSPELSTIPNLKKWVLVFSGDQCVSKSGSVIPPSFYETPKCKKYAGY